MMVQAPHQLKPGRTELGANLAGAGWIVVSCATTTVMSVGVRKLGPDIHSAETAFVRCIVGLLIVLPFVLPHGLASVATMRFKLHLLRGLLAVAGINCGYYALTVLPLVTVTALLFTAPLFVTVLAVSFLGKKVGWKRWVATAVGFGGTLVVVGFHPSGFQWSLLLGLAASVTMSCALVVGKKLSETERPSTILFYFGVITSIGCLPGAIAVWQTPNGSESALLLMVAVFATSRAYCDIRGYAIGHASFVAPFFYLRIFFMGLAGYWVFSETPPSNAVIGAAIIMASTFYIVRSEIAAGRRGVVLAG